MPRSNSSLNFSREPTQWVYHFGPDCCDATGEMRELLGGKGANLVKMSQLGLPVPPGFTITTKACEAYLANKQRFPKNLLSQIRQAVKQLEHTTKKQFGNVADPLLLSVRSGAAVSMPGMMDTILNLGLNDRICTSMAGIAEHRRFVFDAYRRLINMFGNVVAGITHEVFESQFDRIKHKYGVSHDTELSEEGLIELVNAYKDVYSKHAKEPFPQDPYDQLERAIAAVMASWNTPRAIAYREIHQISGLGGTATNVQTMVFGNLDQDSASGVGFTRNPSTGKDVFFGEYLRQAQGEDVVAGIRTPEPIASLKKWKPRLYRQLREAKRVLESHYRDMQDIEFTIERGHLFLLQTRTGKRTAAAAVRIVRDLEKQGAIDRREGIKRIDPKHVTQLMLSSFAPSLDRDVLTTGLAASPGAAVGHPAFSVQEVMKRTQAGESVILVRSQTSADDIKGMHAAKGILTSTGGITSHAAVVARGWGKPCVVAASDVQVDDVHKRFKVHSRIITGRETISLDGGSGEVFLGSVPTTPPTLSGCANTILKWGDSFRTLGVQANADTPEDAQRAREFGAEGIGLCRTEHMFFGENRIGAMQHLLLADDEILRTQALKKLLPMQRNDFIGILSAMRGCPVTIRLLDPPIHEFLPSVVGQQQILAKELGVTIAKLRRSIAAHRESNPMLGNRGCRLLISLPGLLRMQVQAIVEATIACRRKHIKVYPKIMVPLISYENELELIREQIELTIHETKQSKSFTGQLKIPIGTMIETPRAALTADRVARYADFFSFGTNDLTQMTMGFSRDDVGSFMPHYLENHVIGNDPFVTIDTLGVGKLIRTAIELGRQSKPDLEIGICGEHGGEPGSIRFCQSVGVDYVSCSPFRVPAARLAAAQAAI